MNMKHSVLILLPCFDLALARKKKLFRSNVCIDNRQCKSQRCASVCDSADRVCIEPQWFYERHGMEIPECVNISDDGVIVYKDIKNFNERQLGDTCAVSLNCVSEHCVPECDTSNPVWRCIQSRAFFEKHHIDSPRCINQDLFNLAKELDIGENPDKEGIAKSIREITSGRKPELEGSPNDSVPAQQAPLVAEVKPTLRGQVTGNEQENLIPREQEMISDLQESKEMPREQVMERDGQGKQDPREQIMEQNTQQNEQENQPPHEQVTDQNTQQMEDQVEMEEQVAREQGMDQNVKLVEETVEETVEQKPLTNEENSPSIEVQEKDSESIESKQEQPEGEAEKVSETVIDYSKEPEQTKDEVRDTPKGEDPVSEVNMLEQLVNQYNTR